KRPAWQRALARARLPLYDVHWTPAIVLEKPAGKKGEAWRVGLADGRVLPLSIENATAQPKLALYDLALVRVADGKGKRAGRAVRGLAGGRNGGRPGEEDRVHSRYDRRLLVSIESAQSRDPGGPPAGFGDQAAELSRCAAQWPAAEHARERRAHHASTTGRR